MRFGLLALLSFGLLLGCLDAPPSEDVATDPVDSALPECPGGVVVISMAGPLCGVPNPDAGQACRTANDCSGHCLAETMSCSPVDPKIGCFDIVTDDGKITGLCVD
jgi:hypothetical protein